MSVSDPLLKKLKAFIIALRSKNEPVKDGHHLLKPLCETLEDIFLKGLKSTHSWFGSSSNEYWTWISKITSIPAHQGASPMLLMCIAAIKKSKKTKQDCGRGRHFIRTALVKKILVPTLKVLRKNAVFTLTYYTDCGSILGNDILIEILSSLLLELQEVDFNLLLKNASFLDYCWDLPIYKQYELVPSDELGLDIRTVKGYPLVTQVDPNSITGEDEKIMVGDVLDEMCGECLRGVGKSGIYFIFNQHDGQPIHLCVIKAQNKDGSVYPPIEKLLQMKDISPTSPTSPGSQFSEFDDRPPPESLLPEEIEDEVPVHDSEGKAKYDTIYLGKAYLGKDGRVDMIEHGVAEVLARSKNKQKAVLELGEKEVTLTDSVTKELIFQHLFTEVSSCGRRTDALKYFSFIAGETYCSLAKNFYCHVFEATTEEEAKVILCTMAQGFDRTHLMT